jgi:hypothetical protein
VILELTTAGWAFLFTWSQFSLKSSDFIMIMKSFELHILIVSDFAKRVRYITKQVHGCYIRDPRINDTYLYYRRS